MRDHHGQQLGKSPRLTRSDHTLHERSSFQRGLEARRELDVDMADCMDEEARSNLFGQRWLPGARTRGGVPTRGRVPLTTRPTMIGLCCNTMTMARSVYLPGDEDPDLLGHKVTMIPSRIPHPTPDLHATAAPTLPDAHSMDDSGVAPGSTG